jgi:hypothetical protein
MVPDALGAVHGPLDARLPRGTPRYVNYKKVCSPAGIQHAAAIEKARVALGGHNSGHSPILNTQAPFSNLPVSS